MKSKIGFKTVPIRIQKFTGESHEALLMFTIIDHKHVVWHYTVTDDGRLQTLSMNETVVYYENRIIDGTDLLKIFPAFVKIKEEDTWDVLRNEECKQLDYYARPVLGYMRSKGLDRFLAEFPKEYAVEGSNIAWKLMD